MAAAALLVNRSPAAAGRSLLALHERLDHRPWEKTEMVAVAIQAGVTGFLLHMAVGTDFPVQHMEIRGISRRIVLFERCSILRI